MNKNVPININPIAMGALFPDKEADMDIVRTKMKVPTNSQSAFFFIGHPIVVKLHC
jgi:hypothetical protein